MHVGNNIIKESNRPVKRIDKVHGVIEHLEKQFQKYFVPGRNTAIDESTTWFKGKIIFKTYNPPPKKTYEVGHQIICIS
jgi:hypothetical protein